MKKLLGIFLAFLILFVFAFNISASSQTTLNFDLSSDGRNEVHKNSGDIITVEFTIENVTDKTAAYDVYSLANEIYYDHTFFELVEGSAKVEAGLDLNTKLSVTSLGEHRIYFNGFSLADANAYAAKQLIGTFQLKIIATEGASKIMNVKEKMVASGDDPYILTASDLIVRIGDAPISYDLTFETNGGSAIDAIEDYENTVIDLSEYVPTKDNHEFLGWYSDEGLTTPVTSVTLTCDMTVYAKWKDITPTTPPPDEGDEGEGGGGEGAGGEDDKTPSEIIVGAGIKSASVNDDGELVLVLTNGNVMNVGKVNHPDGKTDEFIQSVKFGEGRTSLIITFTDGSRTTVEVSNPGITAPADDDGGINWLYILLILLAVFIIFCLFVLVAH